MQDIKNIGLKDKVRLNAERLKKMGANVDLNILNKIGDLEFLTTKSENR